MKQILVAIDHSEPSLAALDFAAGLAGKLDAELVLLAVLRDPGRADPGLEAYARTEQIYESPTALALEAARGHLAGVRGRATKKGARRISVEVAVGDAAEEILSFAKQGQVDLIVLGSRGHGRLVGLLLGSVAQKVVALATCPVAVVH
jgi:nucleotide-binding universal stress UspA family protein